MPRYATLREEELEIAFAVAKNCSLKKHELHQQIHELSQIYTRTEKSLYILTIRLYFILHGKMPDNITDDNNWYKPSRTLVSFVLSRGHDISNAVKEEMSKEKSIVSREKALELMSDYYKKNKVWIPDHVKKQRELILECIQSGMTVEDAFMEAVSKR